MLRIAEQFHASDLGRQRQGNEDNYFVRSPLFVVADGMGGAQAGEVASEIAVRQPLVERVDRHLRRDLAGLGAAHAVGDDEQGRADEVVVLVALALAAQV